MRNAIFMPFHSIQDVISCLKLWSLLIFPGAGFIVGRTMHFILCFTLGWNHHPSTEIWLSHFFTMAFLIGTLNGVIYKPQESEDPKEKAFFICFNYLGLFGVILGLSPYYH